QRVVVAGNHEIHFVRIAVGVDDADHRNLELARLVDRDLLFLRVDDEHRVGQPRHAADALEVLRQLAALLLVAGDLLLRERIEAAVGGHRFQIPEAAQTALNGREVREEAAEPAFVHEKHAAALRLFGNDVLRLALRADEQNSAALGGEAAHEFFGVAEQLDGLAQVDDVDAVPFAEDVLLHLRIPAFRLVAEVHSGLQQILHRDRGQWTSILNKS